MIEIFRTNSEGTKSYYDSSSSSIMWIMIEHIIHIRKCNDEITEIVVRSVHQSNGTDHANYIYTTTPFDKIKEDIQTQQRGEK